MKRCYEDKGPITGMMRNWLLMVTLAAGIHIAMTWLAAARRGAVASRSRNSGGARRPEYWPSVSVIVPAWNENGTLDACIRTLRTVKYPSWEAIIVAGGTDGTYEAAAEHCKHLEHFRVLRQQPTGKNAGLNQGLRIARGEIIVLLDADSQVAPEWLHSLVAPIDQAVLATTGRPVPLRRTAISQCEQMEQIAGWCIRKATTLQGSGSIALHRSVIEQIGGFPEEVLVGVDWDIDARLAACGIKREFCSQAAVKTERPATLGEYWRNEVRWRRAHLASLFRHSSYFLSSPFAVVSSLYIYLLSWFAVMFTVLVTVFALTGRSDSRKFVLGLWAVFAAWVLLRRAALAGEVAAYLRDLRWLQLAWVPPLLLCISLAAIPTATLTLKRSDVHFKGPRRHNHVDLAS
jgi:cellulose synthase/poly-beta-1,6-N-acetylglucosamine synthase-like glycosyltransferase